MIAEPTAVNDELVDELLAEQFGRPPEDAARDAVVAGAQIDRYLEHLARIQKAFREQQEIAAARKADIDAWLAEEQAGADRSAKWLIGGIRSLEGALNYGKKRSYSLPKGTVGYRESKEGIEVIDAAAALAFAVRVRIARMEPKVGKTELHAYFKAHRKVPDGCEVRPATDKFYVETNEGRITG
jgi:hypothetical protein